MRVTIVETKVLETLDAARAYIKDARPVLDAQNEAAEKTAKNGTYARTVQAKRDTMQAVPKVGNGFPVIRATYIAPVESSVTLPSGSDAEYADLMAGADIHAQREAVGLVVAQSKKARLQTLYEGAIAAAQTGPDALKAYNATHAAEYKALGIVKA